MPNTLEEKNNGQTVQAYTETSPFKSINNNIRKNKLFIFELHIQIKERRYVFKPNAIIDYEVIFHKNFGKEKLFNQINDFDVRFALYFLYFFIHKTSARYSRMPV